MGQPVPLQNRVALRRTGIYNPFNTGQLVEQGPFLFFSFVFFFFFKQGSTCLPLVQGPFRRSGEYNMGQPFTLQNRVPSGDREYITFFNTGQPVEQGPFQHGSTCPILIQGPTPVTGVTSFLSWRLVSS